MQKRGGLAEPAIREVEDEDASVGRRAVPREEVGEVPPRGAEVGAGEVELLEALVARQRLRQEHGLAVREPFEAHLARRGACRCARDTHGASSQASTT